MYVELNLDGTIGGSYFSLLYLAGGVDRQRFEPIVVFASPNELVDTYRAAGIDTRVLQPRKALKSDSLLAKPFLKLLNFVGAKVHSVRQIFQYRALLRDECIDLLHMNNSIGFGVEWLTAAALAGVPCMTHQRGLMAPISPFASLLARRYSAVICISSVVRRTVEATGFSHLKSTTIHNGLDPGKVEVTRAVDDVRSELGIAPSARIVGMVGNIQRWKGQDVVVRAIAKLKHTHPDIVCLLVGAVSQRVPDDMQFDQEIRQLIADAGLERHIILTGYRRDVPNYLNAMEMLIHASVLPEPFGRVLIEGMAQKKPVVAPRSGGAEEIVAHGETGLLYKPSDSDDLAIAIADLYNNEARRVAMGNAGYERLLAHFSIRKNVEATQQLYRSVLQMPA
jgi:glycosyltransferase involved in cell wall biosynthesis